MKKTLIQPTAPDDIEGLQEVLDDTGLFPSEMLPDMLSPAFAGDTAAVWLTCHADGKPAGFCYTEPEEMTEGTWNMRALAVHPSLQGQGLGSALVTAAEENLKENGHRLMIVDTSGTEDFVQTRRFYAQNGFEEEARIRDFWAAGDDKIIFRKALL